MEWRGPIHYTKELGLFTKAQIALNSSLSHFHSILLNEMSHNSRCIPFCSSYAVTRRL
jgi:hypothetical protein